ncbi:hypothetical protein NL676_022162 [Syzygium grande]|nr:hypothetical protein NL676_022162 [Syzygium grande]
MPTSPSSLAEAASFPSSAAAWSSRPRSGEEGKDEGSTKRTRSMTIHQNEIEKGKGKDETLAFEPDD